MKKYDDLISKRILFLLIRMPNAINNQVKCIPLCVFKKNHFERAEYEESDENLFKISVPLQCREEKLFRVELCIDSFSGYFNSISKFLSHAHERMSSNIEEVIFSVDQGLMEKHITRNYT